jgi:hypothetical protein
MFRATYRSNDGSTLHSEGNGIISLPEALQLIISALPFAEHISQGLSMSVLPQTHSNNGDQWVLDPQ